MGGGLGAAKPQKSDRRHVWRALGALLLIELGAFGFFGRGIGFYHDDWVLLEQMSALPSFWARVRALYWLSTRPLDMLLYPVLYSLAGMNTLGQHLLRMAVEFVSAFLFYLLLARTTRLRGFSLASAALALLIPNHEVIHFWFGIACESWATALMFGSLLCHLDWLETKSRGRLAASLALYLMSVLLYEALALFPLALAAALAARELADGGSREAAAKKGLRALLPYGPVLAGALLWQRVGSAVLAGTPNTKTMGFSPSHMVRVFWVGFECIFNRVVHMCTLSLSRAAKTFSWGIWALGVVLSAGGAWLLRHGLDEGDRRDAAVAGAFGAAAFVAAYAPYAFTADYMPQMFGVMSRTNAGGAWPGGMLFAALALAAGRRKFLALWALVFVFTATDWYRALPWARSWTVQQQIMRAMQIHSAALPKGATVLLTNFPSSIEGAVVFQASYDFNGALHVATGRTDLTGDIYGWVPHRDPLLFHYDYKAGALLPAPAR